ncbi:hypothetical protein UT5_21180 [Ferrigenium sp. UT5]
MRRAQYVDVIPVTSNLLKLYVVTFFYSSRRLNNNPLNFLIQ